MATFDEFYASLDPDVGIRGKQFEKFVKWFLKTDPTWASQIENVWLWNEYPKRWGADCGIDLMFTHKNGDTWAVQSKCISPNNDIKKSEIDSFLSESNDSKIDGRLLIASTDGIGKNAQQVIQRQEKQVVCFLLEQFRQSAIEFPLSIKDLSKGRRRAKKTPDPRHQIEAIERVVEGLKNADRGQVLMACGTGKTLTSLWIKEKLKAEQVLVLVPSLSLISQTLKEWNLEANKPFKWICVCSDKSVARDKSEDQWISNTSALGVPVTSEPLEIKNFLDESGSKVIFATYQSSGLIVEAQEYNDTSDFDLVIADEAHRCAGKVSYAFGSVLDENKIKASKRLFFTATPRILSKQIKTKSFEMDFEVASMDDHSLFGEVLYQLKFSEAIANDLLSDYQVVIIGVDDEIIKQKIVNRELIKVDDATILDAEMIASQIAITKAIKEYDLKRLITFHSRIKNAKDFANTFDQVINNIDKEELPDGDIDCAHISGVMRTSERNQKLNKLRNLRVNERKILTNARCLSEGVDVPTLSGIAFIDPKQSQIDIIQAVGRAIRKSTDKTKGTIVIPLYISEEEILDEAILLSNFKKVWQIVVALKSQDDSLMELIDELRINLGSKGKTTLKNNALDKFIFDIPERITSRFSKSIQTILVENSSEDWFQNYGKLVSFFKKEGHCLIPNRESSLGAWCGTQRGEFKKGKLQKERVERLNQIDFIWNILEYTWQENFQKLKEFFKKEGHSLPKDNSSLGAWCKIQRKAYVKNKISQERIDLLNSIKFSWDVFSTKWDKKFNELKEFYQKEGHVNPKTNTVLGSWCGVQRKAYARKSISKERIDLLNSIKFSWDVKEVEWQKQFLLLKDFFDREGHSYMPVGDSTLGIWSATQRSNYKKQKLNQERIDLLNSIKFSWDLKGDDWQEKFEQIKDLYKKEGHSHIPWKESSLGKWVATQRAEYKRGNLSKERIKLLNSINFVWDYIENKWNEKFLELEVYFRENGDSNVSQDNSLGFWCSTQRQDFKKNRLNQKRIDLLNTLNFQWDIIEMYWEENFQKLKKIFLTKDNETVFLSDIEKTRLKVWTSAQRRAFKLGKLPQDKIDLLQEIQFNFDPKFNNWRSSFYKLKEIYDKHGNSNVSLKSPIKEWALTQRAAYKKGKLTQDKIDLLNSIDFAWDVYQKRWLENYQKLRDVFEKEGEINLSKESFLGRWVNEQRAVYRKGKLSNEKVNLLESIKFSWET